MSDETKTRLNTQSQAYTNKDNPGVCMLLGTGLVDEQNLNHPQVGIVTNWFTGNTCNMHLRDLGDKIAKEMGDDGRMIPFRFDVSGVSDGIAMGTDGMHNSLMSRDWIADMIELTMRGQKYDAMIGVPGCDKNMPGVIMAMGRLNLPAIMMYGGSIKPGNLNGNNIDIVSSFIGRGEFLKGKIDEERLWEIYKNSCPGAGACGGMYTANTMASSIEALGMSLPESASRLAVEQGKQDECGEVVKALYHLMERGITPKDIITKEAIDNALTMVMMLGGSTNAALHYPAMAHAVGVEYNLDDIQRVSDRTPFLANLKPSGDYVMADLTKIGGIQAVMKMAVEGGWINPDCLTVTGKTIGENLEGIAMPEANNGIIRTLDEEPFKKTGHIRVLYGNLAPTGAVAKITGKEGNQFSGPAAVFESEEAAIDAFKRDAVPEGSVVVIRGIGPRGAPGMPEMLKISTELVGRGVSDKYALLTDARYSGGSAGFLIGHVSPEAQAGGPIGLIGNGEIITIDAEKRTIDVAVDEADMQRRRTSWTPSPLKVHQGVQLKYARSVSQANKGCITDL